MKAIIAGRLFDTDKAAMLAEACNPTAGTADFRFWEEKLYQTKNGTFFLAGSGGPMSRWSRPAIGGGSQGGSGIREISEEEAREWAERWLHPDEYLQIFSEVEEA